MFKRERGGGGDQIGNTQKILVVQACACSAPLINSPLMPKNAGRLYLNWNIKLMIKN